MITLISYGLGAFAVGYSFGLAVHSLRRFFEQV